MCRRQLTIEAHDKIRLPGSQQLNSTFHREQRGCANFRVKPVGFVVTPHHFAQWGEQMPAGSPTTVLNASANTRHPGVIPFPCLAIGSLAGKTNTVLPAAVAVPEQPCRPTGHLPKPIRHQLITVLPTTTARCSKTERPANDHPIGNIEAIIATHGRGQPSRLSSRNADSDFADTTHGTTGPAQRSPLQRTTGNLAR